MHVGFFDGSSNPNPGHLGLGICVYSNGKEILCGAKPAGYGTNNEAEYKALIWLLEECVKNGITQVTCYGDSQLVIKQVNGQWSVGKQELATLAKKVNSLRHQLDSFDLIWIPRAKNSRADALSKRGAMLKETKIHHNKITVENQKDIVCLSQSKLHKATVMPMLGDELVIMEKNQSIYINTKTKTCSCLDYTKNKTCRHVDALLKVV